MGEINIRFKFDTTTGRKEIVVEYESDSDRLPVEHEKRHREIVEQLVGRGILKPDEAGNVRVERVRPGTSGGTKNPEQPADPTKVGSGNDGAIVRSATPDDAIDVLVVRALSWRAAYRGILPDSALTRLTARWDRELPKHTWVAVQEGILVGYCFAHANARNNPTAAHLDELYVIPELWRAGLGSRLLDAAIAEFARLGPTRMTVEVLAANTAAIRFYLARGFHELRTGEHDVDGRKLPTVFYERALRNT